MMGIYQHLVINGSQQTVQEEREPPIHVFTWPVHISFEHNKQFN